MKKFINDANFLSMDRKIYYSFHEIPFGRDYFYLKPKLRFSREEIKELLISIIVLTIAFSIVTSFPYYSSFYLFIPISFLAVITAFACHEIAHKYMGIKYGYWSEYRMFPQGLLFALLLSFAGFLFAAPGAVMIYGMPSLEESGKISAAGPTANIGVAILFLIIFELTNLQIARAIAFVNIFLAFFNLLPFGPLDGRKIFAWNLQVWVAMLIISLLLLLIVF